MCVRANLCACACAYVRGCARVVHTRPRARHAAIFFWTSLLCCHQFFLASAKKGVDLDSYGDTLA